MADEAKHFIQQFETEVFEAFQNKGGVMSGRSRMKTGVVGERIHFPKIALAGVAQPKTRKGKVPMTDVVRDRIACDLQDYFIADLIEKFDELKTNVAEKELVQSALNNSMRRSEDDIARTALNKSTNAANSVNADDSWASDAVWRGMLTTFGGAEAMEAGSMHALITWKAWADLLAVPSFFHADYNADPALFVEGTKPKQYFGFTVGPYSRLVNPDTGNSENLWWNKKCLGVAEGSAVSFETSWEPEFQAHLIVGTLSMGATLIDQTGVVRRRYAA